jgi:hypothetical protein
VAVNIIEEKSKGNTRRCKGGNRGDRENMRKNGKENKGRKENRTEKETGYIKIKNQIKDK